MSTALAPPDRDSLGPYELLRELKSGGMAKLYLGRREGPGGFARYVAIKTVHAHLAGDDTFVQMFLSEARLAAQLSHPNIVQVEDLGEVDGVYFMAMELVRGVSLHQILRAERKELRPLPPEVAVRIVSEVAAGLHAAHTAIGDDGKPLTIVHRDVSPQNVMVTWTGQVKLLDFGIAKASHDQTMGATLKGKIRYMPPEQAFGRRVDSRTDVYALGLVLWEAVVGRRRFEAAGDFELLEAVRAPTPLSAREAGADISEELDAAIDTALHREPDRRFPTARAFRRALGDTPEAGMIRDALSEYVTELLKDAKEEQQQMLPSSPSVVSKAQPLSAPTLTSLADAADEPRTFPTVRVVVAICALAALGGGLALGLSGVRSDASMTVTTLANEPEAPQVTEDQGRGEVALPAPVEVLPSNEDPTPVELAIDEAATLSVGAIAIAAETEFHLVATGTNQATVRSGDVSVTLSPDRPVALGDAHLLLLWSDVTLAAARIQSMPERRPNRVRRPRANAAAGMDSSMEAAAMQAEPSGASMRSTTMDDDFSTGVFDARMRSVPVREL